MMKIQETVGFKYWMIILIKKTNNYLQKEKRKFKGDARMKMMEAQQMMIKISMIGLLIQMKRNIVISEKLQQPMIC